MKYCRDRALAAFDRSLANDPNFPLALWGTGMILYRDKKDFSGASEAFEKLARIMPPGEQKNQIQNTLAKLARLAGQKMEASRSDQTLADSKTIQGTIRVHLNLGEKVDDRAVLFIIVRSADSSGGPPLAVKKISRPVFPLSYSLGPEDVMMAGMPFSGKVAVSARLDKDGNAMTREEGDLAGEYKGNPAEIGSKKVHIVIDQMM